MSGVVVGSLERKEQLLEAVFGTMRSRQRSDCHVATSPRRDVITSRRHHVATSSRRDVSSKICISSFKVRMAQKLGHREAYVRRHGFPEHSDTDFEEVPGTCTAFHFFGYFRILERCFHN